MLNLNQSHHLNKTNQRAAESSPNMNGKAAKSNKQQEAAYQQLNASKPGRKVNTTTVGSAVNMIEDA